MSDHHVSLASPAVDPGDGERASLPLAVTAALVGEYRWIEHALYGLLGGWVREMPIPAVQLHLDAQSMRHAWHADLWADRLPVLSSVDPDRLTLPSATTAALFAALEGSLDLPDVPDTARGGSEDGGPGALPLLAGLYRVVLPRLVTTYGRHLQAVGSVADAPVRRALRLVLNDEVEDWLAGERLVERLMTRPRDVAAVHGFVQGLEAILVTAGVRPGLVALPDPIP